MEPKISVVIPIYNSSRFLVESINSVLNQTFEDFEAIFVDDGSTDNSLEILQIFAKKDGRIKIFSKENGGSASSRNKALIEASGDFISFFDPDDYISPNFLELAYNNIIENNSDMVIFKGDAIDMGNNIDENRSFFNLDDEFKLDSYDNFSFDYRDIKHWVLNRSFAPWAKMYRKSFLDSYNDFYFDEGVCFEDVPFHIKAMLRANKISYVNESLYHWRCDNPDSVSKNPNFVFDIFKIVDLVYDFLNNEGCFEDFESEFYNFEFIQCYQYILTANSDDYFKLANERICKIDFKFISEMPEFMKKRYDLIRNSNNLKEFKLNNSLSLLDERLNNLNMEILNLRNNLTNVNNELSASQQKNKLLETKLSKSKKKNKNLKNKLSKQSLKIDKLNKKNKELKAKNKQLKTLNNEILSSNSWKITKPLRKIMNFCK